jgi:hypothetical protein
MRPSRASEGFFDARMQRDHLIEMIEGDLQAFENVGAGLGLPQLELRCGAAPPPAGNSMKLSMNSGSVRIFGPGRRRSPA